MNGIFINMFLDVGANHPLRENLPSLLNEIGFSGFLEDDQGLHCFIAKELWSDALRQQVNMILCSSRHSHITIDSVTEVARENWNLKWEQSIQPVRVTRKIVITPSWHSANVTESDEEIRIIIDPKMSFGTGHHETTRIMLRLMEKFIKKENSVLDIGTGTGILAIAAAKLGASRVIGIDIDEWSFTNAIENVRLNAVENIVEIRTGSAEEISESSFDIILANIHRSTILELLPFIIQKVKKESYILLSGILRDEVPLMQDALQKFSYLAHTTEAENEWVGIAARFGEHRENKQH
jgi:ribosomal protein L11 methyltransferase